ncbi:hypothetical protein FLA_6041 [Filimonas lacunae]|nr:hypothetical protein FLA_6041 [Filimonas lacunae]
MSVHAQSANVSTISVMGSNQAMNNMQASIQSTGIKSEAITPNDSTIIIACDFGVARRNRVKQLRETSIIKTRSTDTTNINCPVYTFIKCKTEVPATTNQK